MPAEPRTFLPALTGLRGAAAFWVILFHIGHFMPTDRWPIMEMGWVGVDIFFCFVGFHFGARTYERL
jgi:peptidoglycan/LPS O-acetylase OafA/YrhL